MKNCILFLIFLFFTAFNLLCANKTATALKINHYQISIDGKLTEKQWQEASPISDFRQKDPNEGQFRQEQLVLNFCMMTIIFISVQCLNITRITKFVQQ